MAKYVLQCDSLARRNDGFDNRPVMNDWWRGKSLVRVAISPELGHAKNGFPSDFRGLSPLRLPYLMCIRVHTPVELISLAMLMYVFFLLYFSFLRTSSVSHVVRWISGRGSLLYALSPPGGIFESIHLHETIMGMSGFWRYVVSAPAAARNSSIL